MRTTLTATTALLLLAACSDSPTGSNPLDAFVSLDVATVAADATAEDVDLMAGMNGLPGTISFSEIMRDPGMGPGNVNGCGFGGGRFNCPPNSANGLTITRSIAFFGEADAPQLAYDALLTAKIDVQTTLQGDVSRGPWTATINRTRHFIFTGLLGTETTRTVNGDASGTASRSRHTEGGENRTYDVTEAATHANVVVPVRAEGVAPWPLSGTVTRVFTVTRTGGETRTRTVIITFDGTATPPATVNGEPFTIDLAARRAARRG